MPVNPPFGVNVASQTTQPNKPMAAQKWIRILSSAIHVLTSFSALGQLRFLVHKLTGRQVIVRGHCHQCGACCRRMNLDIRGTWLKSRRQFKQLVQDNPDYARFEIMGRDWGGYLAFRCTWLDDHGRCKNHQHRLPICQNYPDDELYFTGGVLSPTCGYTFEVVPDFKKLLRKTNATQHPPESAMTHPKASAKTGMVE